MSDNKLRGLLDYGRDVAQGASNAIASNVSAPVDGLAWLLRKAGVPMPPNPMGGSDWMAERGLTPQPQNRIAGLLGEAFGMSGPMVAAAKAPQLARGLLNMGDNLAAPRTLNPETGAIVWHGSPHKFDKFDSSKIGTGEGAQVYGHGLYLAESPAVAGQYADNVRAVMPLELKDARSNLLSMESELVNYGGRSRVKQPEIDAQKAYVQRLIDRTDAKSLYKVDLPDEQIAKMLDWDKPLSKQAPEVQAAVRKIRPNIDNLASPMGGKLQPAMNQSGEDFIEWMGRGHADRLREAGVPGIRYLDGGSRGAGSGSSNYVIFPGNEGLLKILERNGSRLP